MNRYFLAAVLVSTLVGCKKDPIDQLPDATQSGKNTAGFLANGKLFTPHVGDGFNLSTSAVSGFRERTRQGIALNVFFADRRSGRQAGLGMHLVNLRQSGVYVLDQQQTVILGGQSPSYMGYQNDLIDYEAVFHSGPGAAATVTITRLDTVRHIVSGLFEATLREDGGTRTVAITDGRFDVTYDPL